MMKEQRIDLKLLEHCLWYKKQFGHYVEPEMKLGALFMPEENAMYRQRSSYSSYYERRVFVYGKSTNMRASDVGTLGPCGKGLKYSEARLVESNLCTTNIYKGK